MTIRFKLNMAVAALLVVFLTSAGFALWSVSRNAESTLVYSRMRELGRLTSDIRTDIYHQLAITAGGVSPRKEPREIGWPAYVLDDIEVQVHLAVTDEELGTWKDLAGAIQRLSDALAGGLGSEQDALRDAEHFLRTLRSRYDSREYDAIAAAASTSFTAQIAISLACMLTVLLFLAYLMMVRDWLVKPIEVLKRSADTIGEGRLGHRVPLDGVDELAQLARRIDLMAERLAMHQQALLEARELSAIGELCTNVAHGLRNPLASLRASAQLAGRRAAENERLSKSLNEILSQVDRVDERITRLFEFSRPSQPVFAHATFGDIARAVRDETASVLRDKEVELVVEDATGDAPWCVDAGMLVNAVSELVVNAAHHSEPGENVRLEGRIESSVLDLRVIDSGKGMTPQVLERAFDLFYTNRSQGSGMGLAMVRRTVERHGGRVDVSSEPGRGTEVILRVPGRCGRDGACPMETQLAVCRACDGRFADERVVPDGASSNRVP